MFGRRYTLLFILLFFLVPNEVRGQQLVRYNISLQHADSKQSYYIDLLKLALEQSKPEYGDYKIEPVVIEMPQGRTSMMVEQGKEIDVTWRMTNVQLEQHLSAVYFPLLKGLMGYRIFIIRAGEQHKFPKTLKLAELQHMPLGQGIDWPDADILEDAGFEVTRSGALELLSMLAKGRFDYFPRALHEPWIEIIDKPQFAVEQNLLIRYQAPLFFFVNRDNIELQKRILLGLTKAYESGAFDEFFATHPITKNILAKAKIDKRTIFTINNPYLSEKAKRALDYVQ